MLIPEQMGGNFECIIMHNFTCCTFSFQYLTFEIAIIMYDRHYVLNISFSIFDI